MKTCNTDAAIDEKGMIVGSGPLGYGSPFLAGPNLRNFKTAITEPLIIEGI